MKDLSNNIILCVWIFFGVVAFSTPNSQEYTGDYTPLANNEQKGIYDLKYMFQRENRTESNNKWGSITDPKY